MRELGTRLLPLPKGRTVESHKPIHGHVPATLA